MATIYRVDQGNFGLYANVSSSIFCHLRNLQSTVFRQKSSFWRKVQALSNLTYAFPWVETSGLEATFLQLTEQWKQETGML
jgi:hypothetical protein